ncbi:hypothetical protein ACQP25_44585 (plasmid) [Microtetraspora malaysiensis]|uniref:hypothetical protein n=1 Tax=Microtetraspora malaysiensis TaxID=161358 RepID=UPI003D8BCDDD
MTLLIDPAPTIALPGTVERCRSCGDIEPTTLDIDGAAITACCGEDLVAFTCPVCSRDVYYCADGSEPDDCPHPHEPGADERHIQTLTQPPARPVPGVDHFGGLLDTCPTERCGRAKCVAHPHGYRRPA